MVLAVILVGNITRSNRDSVHEVSGFSRGQHLVNKVYLIFMLSGVNSDGLPYKLLFDDYLQSLLFDDLMIRFISHL